MTIADLIYAHARASAVFRLYEPDECGADGYPFAWSKIPEDLWPTPRGVEKLNGGPVRVGIKDLVRAAAGDRCIRCGHPYVKGESGEWGEVPQPEPDDVPTLFDGLPELADFTPAAAKAPRAPLWSPCDRQCTHKGPLRAVHTSGEIGEPPDYLRGWQAIKDAGPGWTVQAAWRILTVHHLTGEKADCRWWNLTSLCQRCHLFIQKQVVMERPWLSEHDEWFKPYAAGWYAWKYEHVDLTRAETMARLDELLAHERVM